MYHVHLFKRGKVYWIYYRIHGQRIRKSLDTTNKRIAEQKARAYEKKYMNHELEGSRKRTTFENFWEHYLKYAISVKRSKTISIEKSK